SPLASCRRECRASTCCRSFAIYLLGIKNALADDDFSGRQRIPARLSDLAKETTRITLMASRAADLMDLEKNRVRVAIHEDFADFLDVAALFALAPELISAAAEIDRPAGAQRFFIGFAVHPGEHQHLASGGVLSDGGDKAAGFVEVDGGHWSFVIEQVTSGGVY